MEAKDLEIVEEKREISESGMLVEMAINKDLDVEKLQQVLAMHQTMKHEQAKEKFYTEFAEMQKEFTPIKRTQKGDKGNYAPVDELIKKYGSIISKYGFTYSWDEKQREDKTLEITMTISGHGYQKSNTKILPEYIPDTVKQSGKPLMNVLQAEGTRSTYGYRYTFKAGFGIVETNEDTDGDFWEFADAVKYAMEISTLQECPDIESLKMTWSGIYNSCKENQDTVGRDILMKVYNDRKTELLNGTV